VRDRPTPRAGHSGLLASARRLAQLNIAMADATIAIWNAKNHYDRWRPVTAIHAAGSDGNPTTTPDAGWAPLLTTPAFREYPAADPGVSAAAATVLAAAYDDQTAFTVTSVGTPGVERHFDRSSAAVRQDEDARVFGGIHLALRDQGRRPHGHSHRDLRTGHAHGPTDHHVAAPAPARARS
jgi:hypothetical protein